MTAAAYDLPSMVTGRFLQGVGGGGLVPATLALVADLYPPHRRGMPLGIVGAVQEIGSVLGPLYGAVVLALGSLEGDLLGQPRRSGWCSRPCCTTAVGRPCAPDACRLDGVRTSSGSSSSRSCWPGYCS